MRELHLDTVGHARQVVFLEARYLEHVLSFEVYTLLLVRRVLVIHDGTSIF